MCKFFLVVFHVKRFEMLKNLNLSPYFVCDPSLCAGRDPVDVTLAAVRGGVTMVQLRDKSNDALENARRMKAAQLSVPLLINDHVYIAKGIDADGVHLGQGDMDAAKARAILGPDKIIGVTAFTEEQIKAVDPAVVDYIGTGPFYETKTDKGKPVLGAEKFAALVKLSPVPVVGIGGITPENAAAVIEAGADGVAMMRSISEAVDPEAATRKFIDILRSCGLYPQS